MTQCLEHYTKEQLDEIKSLLPTYTEEEKKEIIRLLIDLAHIYDKIDIDSFNT